MNKKLAVAIIFLVAISLVVHAVVLHRSQIQHISANQTASQIQNPALGKGQPTVSHDGKVSGYIFGTLQQCEIHVVDSQTGSDRIIKTINAGGDGTECVITNINSFSPNDQYVLLDSGTSPTRNFQIIRTSDGKVLANLTAFSQYLWLGDDSIILSLPEGSDRPWGDGTGSGVSKLNFLTQQEVSLKSADETHDYFLLGNRGDAVVNNEIPLNVQTYPATGSERFLDYKMSALTIDSNGNIIK